jgi:hypothetical protein
MYIIRRMRLAIRMLTVTLLALVAGACQNPLGKQYEYEEQVYLKVTGGATIMVDSSVAALVALRGAALDPSPLVRVNQEAVRKLFERGGCQDVQVGQPWRRYDRWFIHVRIEATDIRQVSQCSMLNWSSYVFEHDEAGIHYEQTVGGASGQQPKTNWDGSELVAFRLHMPSRILVHNVRSMDDEPVDVERGNILTWEQTLKDRRAGKLVHLDVRMETESILRRTLTLFAGSFVAAIAALVGVVWLTVRRGRARAQAAQPMQRSVSQ